jgi:anti-sigma factor RsiW
MNPNQLFDYLDGKLSPADREQLEQKLMQDPQLQRQLSMARDIHRGMATTGRQEMVMPPEDPEAIARAGRMGRRIATAAIVLVVLNVAIGMAVIFHRSKKPPQPQRNETEIRQQLEHSLGAAGQHALPAPSLSDDEISVTAPKAEWENLSRSVIAAAQASGGSAVPEYSDSGITVVASIPKERAAEFRQHVVGSTVKVPSPPAELSGETTIVHVRIAEPGR